MVLKPQSLSQMDDAHAEPSSALFAAAPSRNGQFPLDSFLEDAVEKTFDAVRMDAKTDFSHIPLLLAQLRVDPYARAHPERALAEQDALGMAWGLWRPVFWYLCMDDLVRKGTDGPLPVYRYDRRSPIVQDGSVRHLRAEVLDAYAGRACELGTTGTRLFAREIEERYRPLIAGILKRYRAGP